MTSIIVKLTVSPAKSLFVLSVFLLIAFLIALFLNLRGRIAELLNRFRVFDIYVILKKVSWLWIVI